MSPDEVGRLQWETSYDGGVSVQNITIGRDCDECKGAGYLDTSKLSKDHPLASDAIRYPRCPTCKGRSEFRIEIENSTLDEALDQLDSIVDELESLESRRQEIHRIELALEARIASLEGSKT